MAGPLQTPDALDREAAWERIQSAWRLPRHDAVIAIAGILGIRGAKRLIVVRKYRLDESQKKEAFWARVSQIGNGEYGCNGTSRPSR